MEVFRESYNLRRGSIVNLPATDTTKYLINSPNIRGAMLPNMLPKLKNTKNTKLSKTILEFEKMLKKQLIS